MHHRTPWLLLLLALVAAAPAQRPNLAGELKSMAFGKQAAAARTLFEAERPTADVRSPEWLLAASWVARGSSFVGDWSAARKYAREAYQGVDALLAKGASIDQDERLELALGAAIEVLGQASDAAGDKSVAVSYLADQRERFSGTKVETRIQKNYLLISLEGKKMPELAAERFLSGPQTLDTDGNVALFYFWAHWCPDCKNQTPVLEQLHQRYGNRGLRIIGPTQLYGYVAGGEDATPAQERAYVEGPWQQRYRLPEWMPKPLDPANFTNFGVSTTPTLVLADRQGVVRLYHPGEMSAAELEAAIRPLLLAGT